MSMYKPSGALRATLGTFALGLMLAACGGGGGGATSAPATPVTPAATELTLGTTASDVASGGAAVTLTATLNGTGTVSWALAAGNPGTLSATTGASVNYTPPRPLSPSRQARAA